MHCRHMSIPMVGPTTDIQAQLPLAIFRKYVDIEGIDMNKLFFFTRCNVYYDYYN